MKNTFILLTAVVLSTFMFSCDEDDNRHVFTETTTTYFEEVLYTINALENVNTTTDIMIVSTNVSSVDRQYSLEVDPSSTASMGIDFILSSSTVTIPANTYFGVVTVTSILTENTINGVTAIFNLSGSSEVSVFDNVATVDINHKTCDIFPEIMFSGDYLLEQVGGDNGFGNAFLETGNVVTLINDGGNVRSFQSIYLVDVGQPAMTFSFSLDCSQVIPLMDQSAEVSCGELITLSPSEATVQSYTPFDDSEIIVTFIETISEDCPLANTSETTIKLTKIL